MSNAEKNDQGLRLLRDIPGPVGAHWAINREGDELLLCLGEFEASCNRVVATICAYSAEMARTDRVPNAFDLTKTPREPIYRWDVVAHRGRDETSGIVAEGTTANLESAMDRCEVLAFNEVRKGRN